MSQKAKIRIPATPPEVDAQRYPVEVFWSDEDAGFIARAPDLPGCSAWGSSASDALCELREAIVAWASAANSAGNPIPPPSKPAVAEQVSGKILLRMPKQLHAGLARAADTEGVSLNHYVVYLLTRGLAFSVMSQRAETLRIKTQSITGTATPPYSLAYFPDSILFATPSTNQTMELDFKSGSVPLEPKRGDESITNLPDTTVVVKAISAQSRVH
jgi:predicted RNase H-like HicB family nuclease